MDTIHKAVRDAVDGANYDFVTADDADTIYTVVRNAITAAVDKVATIAAADAVYAADKAVAAMNNTTQDTAADTVKVATLTAYQAAVVAHAAVNAAVITAATNDDLTTAEFKDIISGLYKAVDRTYKAAYAASDAADKAAKLQEGDKEGNNL